LSVLQLHAVCKRDIDLSWPACTCYRVQLSATAGFSFDRCCAMGVLAAIAGIR
jgi:hypothetical protein